MLQAMARWAQQLEVRERRYAASFLQGMKVMHIQQASRFDAGAIGPDDGIKRTIVAAQRPGFLPILNELLSQPRRSAADLNPLLFGHPFDCVVAELAVDVPTDSCLDFAPLGRCNICLDTDPRIRRRAKQDW